MTTDKIFLNFTLFQIIDQLRKLIEGKMIGDSFSRTSKYYAKMGVVIIFLFIQLCTFGKILSILSLFNLLMVKLECVK